MKNTDRIGRMFRKIGVIPVTEPTPSKDSERPQPEAETTRIMSFIRLDNCTELLREASNAKLARNP